MNLLPKEIVDRKCRVAQEQVAKHYDVKADMVTLAPKGSRALSRARHEAMFLCHHMFGLRHGRLVSIFNRDRTTIWYGCTKVVRQMDNDPNYKDYIYSMAFEIEQMLAQ